MGVKITNNAAGTLAASITNSATTLTVTSGQGALFPTLTGVDYCWLTLVDVSNNVEVIKCTARSTDSFTIVRAQDNTTARAFAISDRLELRPTAALFDEFANPLSEKGSDISSASPLVITAGSDYFDVTGTTNFAAMTVAVDRQFTLQFDGVLTMTHHATNLDLPGLANITTAAGDVATFQSTGANTVQCINYTRADGIAIVATLAALTDATVSSSDPTTSSNPSAVGHLWVNSTSGEQYVCTNATTGANIWINTGEGTGNVVPPPYNVEYLVIAGGGGAGGRGHSGGGGAGGYLKASGFSLTVGTSYTVTVGSGGAGSSSTSSRGTNGSNSVFSSITSTGGGGGGSSSSVQSGSNGGSGGGAAFGGSGGSGIGGQGYGGGNGSPASADEAGGGGGGASAVGAVGSIVGSALGDGRAGAGGNGTSSSITGSAITYAGGGGGGTIRTSHGGAGGTGGGGRGYNVGGDTSANTSGTDGTGGGGGGGHWSPTYNGGDGGDGVVILRMLTSDYSGTTTGSPTAATDGSYKVLTFSGDGTYTA